MKSIFRYVLVTVCAVAVVSSFAMAQDLQEQLSKLGSDAAKGYVSPILSGWGADLNSAFYHSADLHDVLGFDVGVKVGLAKITDDDKTYKLTMPGQIKVKASEFGIAGAAGNQDITFTAGQDYDQVVTANTAVGPKDSTVVKLKGAKTVNVPGYGNVTIPTNKTLFILPGGFDIGAIGVPLPMPQLAVGLPFGLEVMVRYIPTVSAGDAGKFNYSGFGVRYDIDQWLPLFPIDIAVHFMTQKMNFKSKDDKDIFSASGTAYGVEISKKLLILTLYGGFQLEKSKMTLSDFVGYDPALGQNINVKGFEVEGKNKSRVTVGARILLLIANVHVEYSIAKTPVIAAGVGISLR